MKTFRTIALAIAGLLALVMAVGLFLPTKFDWRAHIDVAAPPETIHRLVGDLERWPEWTPFQEDDPSITVRYGDTTRGVGARQQWEGESGTGSLTFTKSDPAHGVAYDLVFDDQRDHPLRGSVSYERVGKHTRVTWRFWGDLGGKPLGGYFVKLMAPVMDEMFERGMERLKVAAEAELQRQPANAGR